MLYERATVLDCDGRWAWVQAASQAGCARCAAGRGCGGGIFGRLLGSRLHRVRALNEAAAAPGDTVLLGLHEAVLWQGALRVYGWPLGLLLVGVLVGQTNSDVGALLGGVLGFGCGLLLSRWHSRRLATAADCQPAILRVVPPGTDCFPETD